MDNMPLPVCRFARANRCRRLREVSAYGYDEVARQKCFGLRVHARIAWQGVIRDLELLPANVHDTLAAEEMLVGVQGRCWRTATTETGFARPPARAELVLLAPFSTAKHEKTPWPRKLTRKRYRIETVFGQLVERFQARQVWARDAWHLCSRWLRVILAHCLACSFVSRPACHHFDFLNLLTCKTRTPGWLQWGHVLIPSIIPISGLLDLPAALTRLHDSEDDDERLCHLNRRHGVDG
ncbi:MAG: transposase [Chloroflexota bacterium]